MGLVITAGAVVVMAGVWIVLKIVDKRRNADDMVEEKMYARYMQTGQVGK